MTLLFNDNNDNNNPHLNFPLLGNHNIENALAAISVCINFNINKTIIKESLESFQGVKRRLTKIFDKDDETFFRYSPTKKYKKITSKKISNENPFKILKNLNLN